MTAETANTLKQVFDAIHPRINEYMIANSCSGREMLQRFNTLHTYCIHIVLKQMQDHLNWTPRMFSEAVHQQVMQQNYYTDERWQVVAAVFEYTCLRIEACLKQRASRDAYGVQIQQTHTTVRETKGKLDSFEKKLDELLSILKSSKVQES